MHRVSWYSPNEDVHFVDGFTDGEDGDFVAYCDSMRSQGYVLDGVEWLDQDDLDEFLGV